MGDNFGGIDCVLVELWLQIVCYWSVVDGLVVVLEGGIWIIEGSCEWWCVCGVVWVLIVNDWLCKCFCWCWYQYVLQIWYGMMFKRFVFDWNLGFCICIVVWCESVCWDVFFVQNEYSVEIFCLVYVMCWLIWQYGYFCNDVFIDLGVVVWV